MAEVRRTAHLLAAASLARVRIVAAIGALATLLLTFLGHSYAANNAADAATELTLVIALAGTIITALGVVISRSAARQQARAEHLVAMRTDELGAAQERFRRMVEQAPDATLIVASDGTIELASRRVQDLTGHWPDDLVGKPIEVLIPEVLRSVHREHRNGFINHPHAREMGAGMELTLLHIDGREVPVEVSLSPVVTANGELTVIAALRDVTIRRQTQDALRSALERQERATRELARTDALRTRFLETVSHELRTPLTAIVGFTDLLLNLDGLTEERQHEMLVRIDRNAHHLTGLITDLLESTRLERDAIDVTPEPVDLVNTVDDVRSQLATVLNTHDLDLRMPPSLVIMADRRSLVRILTNLLTNAARYSPDGSTITIVVETATRHAILRVTDEGPGIPEEERELVFERFYRGRDRAVMSVPGSGIGLSVVRHLLRLQNGTVEVCDGDTAGACVQVKLPLATGDLDQSLVGTNSSSSRRT